MMRNAKAQAQGDTQAVMEAMRAGAAMSINGVAGRWNAAGSEWAADQVAGTDAVVLVRISDAEEDEIDGVARQVADVRTLATRMDVRVRTVLVENDTSAFKRKKIRLPNGDYQLRTVRPKFRRALSMLAAGDMRYFLNAHLDRTVRDPRDLEDLIDVVEGSSPRIVCESVTGSLRLANDTDITAARILCAVANQASRDTARRVTRARLQQAEEARFGGGRRRYGFEPDGVTQRSEEAQVIKDAAAAVIEGVSMKEIARDFNRAGSTTGEGKPWTASGIRDILLRPRNAGLSVHRPGRHGRKPYTPEDVVATLPEEPILDPEDYWSLVHKLTDPDRRTNPGTATRWLGSGIYRCPCGSVLRSQFKKYRSVQRQVYRCTETGNGHVIVPQAELDALVAATVQEMIAASDPEEIMGTSAVAGVDVAALHAELARHRAKLDEIAADYDDDVITRSQMLTRTRKRREKIAAVQAQVQHVSDQRNPAVKLIGARDIRAAWEALTLGEQRECVRRFLNVTAQRVGRGKRLPVRDRVTITRSTPAPQAA